MQFILISSGTLLFKLTLLQKTVKNQKKENIQYVKISEVYRNRMRKQFANEVKLTSMVISLAEQTNKEYKEDVRNLKL